MSKKSIFPRQGRRVCQRFCLFICVVVSFVMLIGFTAYYFYSNPKSIISGHGSQLSKIDLPDSGTCDNSPPQTTIPNIVHYVYVLPDPSESDFKFKFSHFLSIYAVWHYWRPNAIYLHTNVGPEDDSVTRARRGDMGKWTQLIFTVFDLKINKVHVPSHASNGREIEQMEHKSDFVRVKAVHDYGGIYIDWDVHPLQDVKVLRDTGFKGIVGRQSGGQINSGTFMSVKCSKLLGLWQRSMHLVYDGKWTTHSNEALTELAQRLIREPGEVLIMDRDAFAPGGWSTSDNNMLFATHSTGRNDFDLDRGRDLPTLEEGFFERWNHPDNFPSWTRDWSSTYLLHAFAPERFGHMIWGYKSISPRYVLERRSNFARAVYPVALEMYKEGIMQKEDLFQE